MTKYLKQAASVTVPSKDEFRASLLANVPEEGIGSTNLVRSVYRSLPTNTWYLVIRAFWSLVDDKSIVRNNDGLYFKGE